MSEQPDRVTIGVSLSSATAEWLAQLADDAGSAPADVIRELVNDTRFRGARAPRRRVIIIGAAARALHSRNRPGGDFAREPFQEAP
jgi:hypothetical protein